MNGGTGLVVIFRDVDFLVVDKPSGIATTSPDGRDCLAELVAREDHAASHHHPTSRLDAEVSGVVVFARTSRGIEHALRMRAERRYRRLYVALASGRPVADTGTWSFSLAVDPRDKRRRVVSSGPDAIEAATDYEVLPGVGPVSVLALAPRTGRTHQLRVHASHAGVPLVGDVHYGGPRRVTLPDGRVVTAMRTMLHCARVELPLPGGAHAKFVSAVPADFSDVSDRLGLRQLVERARADASPGAVRGEPAS